MLVQNSSIPVYVSYKVHNVRSVSGGKTFQRWGEATLVVTP